MHRSAWFSAVGLTAAVLATLISSLIGIVSGYFGGKVDLKVPPESDTGKRLRLKGRGMPSKGGHGDQLVELEIIAPAPQTPNG